MQSYYENAFGLDEEDLVIPGAWGLSGNLGPIQPKETIHLNNHKTSGRLSFESDSQFEKKQSKHKSRTQDELARCVISTAKLISVGRARMYRYNSEYGYYQEEASLQTLILEILGGEAATLSTRDIKDLGERLPWYPEIQLDYDTFNRNPDLINAENGVVRISDGTLLEHSEEHYFTYTVNARYLEDKSQIYCPVFEQYCFTSLDGNPEKQLLLLEILGYCICDSNQGKCACFLKGQGDSGKSVIAEFVSRLFTSNLVANIPLHLLSARFNRAPLFGAKINIAGEIQASKLRDTATFKAITGGDRISAEFKGKPVFSFTPRCKLLFCGNALLTPSEADLTTAFANRLVVLLFNSSICKEDQDNRLSEKLFLERDSIFTLAVDALRDLQQRNYQFSLPQESRSFINSFAGQGDSFKNFLTDCCIIDTSARIHNVDLISAYYDYCRKNGYDCCSKERFYDLLSGIPGVTPARMRIESKNLRGHKGITIKT